MACSNGVEEGWGGEGRERREGREGREGRERKEGSVYLIHPSQILIPVFALGRAQELCILLESYWCVLCTVRACLLSVRMSVRTHATCSQQFPYPPPPHSPPPPPRDRMNLTAPIYFTMGLTEKVHAQTITCVCAHITSMHLFGCASGLVGRCMLV